MDDKFDSCPHCACNLPGKITHPRDPDLVRLVAALASSERVPDAGCFHNDLPDRFPETARRVVACARALLVEIDRPAEGAKL